MRRFVFAALILFIASPLFAAQSAPEAKHKHKHKHKAKPKELKLKTEEDKTLYAVGLVLARQLTSFSLTPAELRIVKQGLTDGVRGRKDRVDFTIYSKKSQEMGIARRDAHGKKLEPLVAGYLEEALDEEGAVKSTSGVVYIPLKEGTGESPTLEETVKVQYRSLLIDGQEVDNTYKRGEGDEAKLNGFIKCLSEGIQMMKLGGRAKLICPPETALGKEGYGLVPPNATLVYEVELVEIAGRSSENKPANPELK